MDVDQEVRRVCAVLAARHPLFAERTVERLVARLFQEYDGAPVQQYLPILVERAAEDRLRDLDRDYRAPLDRRSRSRRRPGGETSATAR